MITSDELERIRNSDLPAPARHVFCELTFRAGTRGENKGICWPSIRTLSHDTGYSERQVRKMIKLLKDHEWIRITKRKNAKGQTSNLYRIRPIEEGPGNPMPMHHVHTPPAPRAAIPPAPRAIPPAPRAAEALHETELPHEDHEETRKGIDQIRQAWADRNPPYWDLDVTQARRLIDRYTAAEIINAINSYEHVNDLNPYQLTNRIEILRDFPEFSHKNGAKHSQKTAKKGQKRGQKRGQNPLKN